jgi:hypothetical protein
VKDSISHAALGEFEFHPFSFWRAFSPPYKLISMFAAPAK